MGRHQKELDCEKKIGKKVWMNLQRERKKQEKGLSYKFRRSGKKKDIKTTNRSSKRVKRRTSGAFSLTTLPPILPVILLLLMAAKINSNQNDKSVDHGECIDHNNKINISL